LYWWKDNEKYWKVTGANGPTIEYIDEFGKERRYLFPIEGMLWAYSVIPNSRVLRYETLRKDLNNTFLDLGLPPLKDDEFVGKQKFSCVPRGKPAEAGWTQWRPEVVRRVEAIYGEEMDRFNYSFEQYRDWNV